MESIIDGLIAIHISEGTRYVYQYLRHRDQYGPICKLCRRSAGISNETCQNKKLQTLEENANKKISTKTKYYCKAFRTLPKNNTNIKFNAIETCLYLNVER